MQADAALADRQLQPPVHQFASLSLEHPSLAAAPPPNRTGLPDRLKAGIEHLSGFAIDDVRVHYNSSKPATVQALAYARGNEIHVGPGQEQHLPHEAWHVVQQAEGRVKPTLQMKGVAINDDAGLEREADAMGRQAAALQRKRDVDGSAATSRHEGPTSTAWSGGDAVAQRVIIWRGASYDGTKPLPKSLTSVHGLGGLQYLAQSPTPYNLDKGGDYDVKVSVAKANAAAELEKKKQQTASEKHKAGQVSDYVNPEMEKHMAGEDDKDTVSGGHLLTSMVSKYGEDVLYYPETADNDNVWSCTWGLLKQSGIAKRKAGQSIDEKDYRAGPKAPFSTMFPASWSWKDLVDQLEGSNDAGGGYRTLEGGITVQKKGKTYFPIL